MRSRPAIFLLAVAFTIGIPWAPPLQAQGKVGDVFPDPRQFAVEGTSGLGGKVVIVDFWASWCGPCRASFPALERLYAKHRGAGLRVVAISVDTDPAAMKKFLVQHPVSFPVGHDRAHKLADRLQLKTMPTSYVLSKGVIRFVHNEFQSGETEKTLAFEIEQLLK